MHGPRCAGGRHLTRRLRATAGYQVKLERHLVANRFPFLVASRSVTIDNL